MDGNPAGLIHLSQDCIKAVRCVTHQGQMDERGSSSRFTPVPVVIYRCIHVGVRSSSSGPHSLGSVVVRGIARAHQHPGDVGSITGPGIISPPASRTKCHQMSDNMSVVAYLRHQGGTVSRRLFHMASVIAIWAERHSIHLETRYIPGKRNSLADQLSCLDQILPTEWYLLPRVFDGICRELGRPHLDLFTTRANNKLPLYVSLVPDPLAWKQDALHLPLNHLDAYAFPPFALLPQVISRVMESEDLRLASERVVRRPSGPSRGFQEFGTC